MRRTARRARDALRERRIVGRHDVGSARTDDVGMEERLHEKRQPVGIDARVGVGIGDDLSRGFRQTDVARRAQPLVRRIDDAHARITAGNLAGAILRTVVDEDDLEVGVREPLEGREVVVERVSGVVGADDHRHARPRLLLLGRKRRVRERRRDGDRRGLQGAIAIDEPELPVVDRGPAAPPLVGPRVRHDAARAFFERGADVHRRDLGLSRFAFADRIGACLGEEQRFVSRDVLQPRQVRAQLRLAVQVHVESTEIEERQVEKLRRRKVHVGEQALGRRALRVLIERAQVVLDAHAAVPAHDAGRDLVSQREGEERRMITELAHPAGQLSADLPPQVPVVEKRDVLRPRQPDHDLQSAPPGLVEQFASRHRVGANGIQAKAGHQPEVFSDLRRGRELVAVRVRRERPIGDAFDKKARTRLRAARFGAQAQELAVGCDSSGRRWRRLMARHGPGLDCCTHSR